MSVTAGRPGVGELLREWRTRRRLSQMELSLEAQVSARHLSFVETGRSRPSRELVLHLAEHLDVPLRERNGLLLAAGYAPTFSQTPWGSPDMAPVRAALDKILSGHEPFPAIAVDRRWDLVAANRSATGLLAGGIASELLQPVPNALRLSLHPDGLASRIVNLAEWSSHLLDRLHRQVVASGDPDLQTLEEELRGHVATALAASPTATPASTPAPPADPAGLFVPLVLRSLDGEVLRFLSTVTTFGTALDITVAELAVESFLPADDATAQLLHATNDRASEPAPER
jgi:transcriptional regulator with XRE-family HTH domain